MLADILGSNADKKISVVEFAKLTSFKSYAVVAKLVDALDLGSSVARRESSSLSDRTMI